MKLDTQLPIKWFDMVRIAKSSIGSLTSSEGSLLCTDTWKDKHNNTFENYYQEKPCLQLTFRMDPGFKEQRIWKNPEITLKHKSSWDEQPGSGVWLPVTATTDKNEKSLELSRSLHKVKRERLSWRDDNKWGVLVKGQCITYSKILPMLISIPFPFTWFIAMMWAPPPLLRQEFVGN